MNEISTSPVKLFSDGDASLAPILRKKIGVIGYGNQGRAQALNLKDSGCNVRIGLRKGSGSAGVVESDGLQHSLIETVTRWADVIVLLIPDDEMKNAYQRWIVPNLQDGSTLIFSHGFAIHYGLIRPAPRTVVLLCAPSGPGKVLRDRFIKGGGLPGLISVHQGPSRRSQELILSYAKAIGITRVGAVLSTFREETETDLFGEQVILTGGLPHLIRSAFNTLVKADYQPVTAWLVCFYEVKMIVELFSSIGLEEMKKAISETAEYGGETRGKRLISKVTRKEMDKILYEIRSRKFYNEYTNRNSVKTSTTGSVSDNETSDLFDRITREFLSIFNKQ